MGMAPVPSQQLHSVGGNTAAFNFFVLSECRLQTGQQQQSLHPSQVPRSASQPRNRSLLVLSSAGLTFFAWSGVTYERCFTSLMPHSLIRLCLAACGSSSRPHQTHLCFKSLFSFVASYRNPRPFFFFFSFVFATSY